MDALVSFYDSFGAYIPYVIGYTGLLWVAVVFWVAKDVSNRSLSIPFQLVCITITTLFFIFGLFLYLLIRPEKTLLEKDFEELFYVLREKEIL